VRDIQREEKKVEKSIKDCAKRNDVRSMAAPPVNTARHVVG
jgi:hypothetical protein